MIIKENTISLSDLKANPGKVVSRANAARSPILLTSRGRSVAVLQTIKDYEDSIMERDFLRAVVMGLLDLDEGRETSIVKVKKRLGLV